MLSILAVLQGVFVLSMILLVLIQKTSSDGMANLASSSGSKSMHSSIRMDFVKKSTIFFVAAFMINSIVIANIGYHINNSNTIEKYIEENNTEIKDDE